MKTIFAFIMLSLSLICPNILAQQIADTTYTPPIKSKMYPDNDGTKIFIDEAHNNFHTMDGRYQAFARVLRSDGYKVVANTLKFDENSLKNIEILVLANAEADGVTHPIVKPTKSAFSTAEIKSLEQWVTQGGSLFLIADHMPFAGASADLAAVFGFTFYDGFVMYHPRNGIIDFNLENKTLSPNFITNGRNDDETVKQVRTFTGQGFVIPRHAISILKLDDSQTVYLTDTMWVFNEKVETFSAEGLSQGAIFSYGKGKISVFGEAAMFSAQWVGKDKMKIGMNSQESKENHQLLLNVIHWLDDRLN